MLKKIARKPKKPLRILFQDEARLGPISEPRWCWCFASRRPIVKSQGVRDYTDLYAALSPVDGPCDFLILAAMTKACRDSFLEELSQRYPNE